MVVLGCGAKPGLADSHTITTCCALRCLPQPLPASTLVIVELQLVQNLEIARQVAGRAGSSALSVVPCCVGQTLTLTLTLTPTLTLTLPLPLTLTLAAANPNPNLKPGAVLRRPNPNPTPNPSRGSP